MNDGRIGCTGACPIVTIPEMPGSAIDGIGRKAGYIHVLHVNGQVFSAFKAENIDIAVISFCESSCKIDGINVLDLMVGDGGRIKRLNVQLSQCGWSVIAPCSAFALPEIGRASCRERVGQYG